LDPPELGKLKLQMHLQQNQLALQIDTQTVAARRLLSEQLDTLRHSLEVAGIQLERVEVRAPEQAHTPAPSGTPTDSQGEQEAALADQQGSERDEPPAGGGARSDTEVGDGSSVAHAGTEAEPDRPATESRVNILA
jgi:flagellar hook-length control protein FliK